jgi:hypothetical protein
MEMNIEKDMQRIANSNKIKEEHKPILIGLLEKSTKIEFGKIGPRQEGYIYEAVGYPRCTSVLQMDGTKAAALMEWAKREVADFAKENLKNELRNAGKLTDSTIELILDNALNNPDKQRDDAASVGTTRHDNIEHWLNGEEFEETDYLNKFINIWKAEDVELICTEMPLVYKFGNKGFGGKLDILAYKDGELIIYDNKTSRSVHNSYGLQVSGYKRAVEQMIDSKLIVNKAKIIHLPDETTLKEWQLKQYKKLGNLIELKNLDEAFSHFELLLEQYYKRNNKYF